MKHNIHIREITKDEKEQIDTLFGENQEALNAYAELLLWWNKKINLVSRGVSRETVMHHIRHSLFVMLSEAFKEATTLIDAGTGGGLPGLPLAICVQTKKYLLNDIVSKKIFAVNDMIKKLNLLESVQTRAGSIEQIEAGEDTVLITKHAFKIGDLLSLTQNSELKEFVFLKGVEEAVREIEEVSEDLDVEVLKLDTPFMDEFYSGKGVVTLKKRKL